MLASNAGAQSAPAEEGLDPPPPIFALASATPGKSPAPVVAPTPRSVSPELAAVMATVMPKYQYPSTLPKPVAVEADKPRNKIFRLPAIRLAAITVRQRSEHSNFTEREIYTEKGLEELAVKRYFTEFDYGVLNRFTLPLFGESSAVRAMRLYEHDEAIKNAKEIADLTRLEAIKDPPTKPEPASDGK